MTQRRDIEVNAPLCTSCRLCEITCSLFHEEVINMEKSRVRVRDNYEELLFEPHICRLCADPPCTEACPSGSLSQDENGVIRVDEASCNGCESCITACPYQALWWREKQGRLFVCDRCGGDPVCVKSCTIGALRLVEPA